MTITKERMCNGTGWGNHFIAYNFGWCEKDESYCPDEQELMEGLYNFVRDVMYANDCHEGCRINDLVTATHDQSHPLMDIMRFTSHEGQEFSITFYSGKWLIARKPQEA